jgi:hypothetical protein
MKFLAPVFLVLLLVTCTTYDSAIIYHKNFRPGYHPLLRFSGYYADSVRIIKSQYPYSDLPTTHAVKPVFFYSDGSCFSCDKYEAVFTVNNSTSLQGSWGNYLIKGDTIRIEKFQLVKSNYRRIILKGVISADKIHWVTRQEHNEAAKPVDYSIDFNESKSKPDSLRNFIRTKEKYNQ